MTGTKYKSRKQAAASTIVTIPWSLGTMPPQFRTKLRYTGQVTITTSALSAGNGYWLFSANGMYDPDTSGTGTQPWFFDQMMGMYAHYRVISSRIKVQFMNAANVNYQYALFKDDDTTSATTTNINLACQRAGMRASGYFNGSVKTPPSVSAYWSAAKTFGGDPASNEELWGNAGGNPNEQTYYVIQIQDLSGAATDVQCKVDMEFWAEFFELASVPAS